MPVLPILLFCANLLWVGIFLALAWTLHRLPRFEKDVTSVPERGRAWPRLSVIVPACNEAEQIETALSSLRAQDYPELEIIVVDDRSTDATGIILDRLARSDPRLRVLHITDLPAGWLGKVHALQQGVSQANGEWFLFTDADVRFAPGMLQRALAYAETHGSDHLALLPGVILAGLPLAIAVQSFGLLFLLTTRAALVNRPGSRTPMGIGAFNLVRADLFRRTPGFSWLRLEPGDDYALGVMLREAGARTRFALADTLLTVPWYPDLAAMFRGLEKNLFGPGAHYQWWRMLLQVSGLWLLVAAPPVALLLGMTTSSPLLLTAAAVAIASHLLFAGFGMPAPGRERLRLLALPLGFLLLGAMLLWSGLRCLRHGGIAWRGTRYSLAELRAGQRVRF